MAKRWRRRQDWNFGMLGIIGGAIAGGVALIPLIPMVKRRAMRVTSILKKDHRLVSGLIMTLEFTPRINSTVRRKLLEQITNSVMVHAQAEEEVLYPALRTIFVFDNHNQSKVDEAYHEHQQVKDLLHDLSTMDPTSEVFDIKFNDFKMKLEHHVEEEEGEVFPMILERMSGDEQQELGQRIHDRKMTLKTKMAA
jgi:hemerythrin superfamily protein